MTVLVRTWNVFHGNAVPTERRAYLEEAVRLATADAPHVVCLQEVPAWALPELGRWSSMQALGEIAARPTVGPLPSTAGVGRVLTSVHHGFLRSGFSGQANAILLRRDIRVLDRHSIVLNPRRFRRAQARWLSLRALARLAWAKERRVCQALSVRLPDGRSALVANLHATSYPPDRRLADAEVLRGAVFADGLAPPDEVCVLAGDFNVTLSRSRTLPDLASPEWGFSRPGPGIDHVLVRGAESSRPHRWPPDRRRVGGRIVSDHAPVEVTIE